jgi:alpha-tubulin suppressor-like RCC1 family protein
LGNGLQSNSSSPVPVLKTGALNGLTIKKVKAGYEHTCALASNDLLYCWGINTQGQLGNGTNTDSIVPVPVTMTGTLSGKTIKDFALGTYHSCAIASDDLAYCWGGNWFGILGNGTLEESSIPIPVSTAGVLNGHTIKSIAVGRYFSCVIASDDFAYCWGQNTNGQLGDGTSIPRVVPVAVKKDGALNGKTLKNLSGLTGSSAHTCAIASDDNLYCWGSNTFGELGDGTQNLYLEPVMVKNDGALQGKTLKSSAADTKHTCAITSDGNLYCWGDNVKGELGTGNTTDSLEPMAVDNTGALSGKTILMVSVGYSHSCAMASDYKIYCWGDNKYGQVGTNSFNTPYLTPVQVVAPIPSPLFSP